MKRCVHKETGQEYAVKIMRHLDEERLLAAQNEFNILTQLHHKHIVEVKEFIITDMELFTVMELVKGEELLNRISGIEKYNESIARKLFK